MLLTLTQSAALSDKNCLDFNVFNKSLRVSTLFFRRLFFRFVFFTVFLWLLIYCSKAFHLPSDTKSSLRSHSVPESVSILYFFVT